ncbi:MAG: hypothetical protein KBG15_03955 [Kofleriaceae bacterium]|nr:hypothetical protein [Kofleriaceae bacterium]
MNAKTLRAGVLGLLVLASAVEARADIFTVSAQIDGGGTFGKGIGGDQKTTAFYQTAPHGVYGLKLNAEVLFIDAWIAHHQFTNGSRLATWSEVGVGMDTELPLGGNKNGLGGYLLLGIGATFGVGTGQQVQLPLDNGELSDKGFALVAKLGGGSRVSKLIDLGVEIPISAGYYFKSGAGAVANNLSTHYQAANVQALLFLRFRFGAK